MIIRSQWQAKRGRRVVAVVLAVIHTDGTGGGGDDDGIIRDVSSSSPKSISALVV